MHRLIRRLAVPPALAAVLLGTGGCVVAALAAGAAATYGTIKYTENEATRDFRAPLDRTWSATLEALRAMGYAVADHPPTGPDGGRIEIGDADVRVDQMPGEYVRVSVRIGTFSTDDHRRRAGLILEKIAEILG